MWLLGGLYASYMKYEDCVGNVWGLSGACLGPILVFLAWELGRTCVGPGASV